MNTERDKPIAEALGICWHEVLPNFSSYYCGKCKTSAGTDLLPNPNFSTFDGMGLILQKGPEREWWIGFLNWLWLQYLSNNGEDDISRISGVEHFYVENSIPVKLLQDPDRLANELYTFLKGEVR